MAALAFIVIEEVMMSKNIVVLSDGTGQDGGTGHDSNIYML